MGFALGFLPWVLYWALIGNVPFRVAAVLVLVVAIAVQVLGRLRRQPWRSLEVGSLAVFALLAVAAFVVDDDVLARWMQPLSNLGIFLVALGGLAVGRPFVREYAAASVDDRTARTDGFATITRDMTVLWVGVFAAMTVVSAIPPVVDGAATLRDGDDLLSILCYWVLPYVFLAVGGLASGLFPPWFEKRSALVDQRETAEAPHPAAQRPSPPDVAAAPLALEVPAVSRHDEPFPVVVRGLPAGAAVHVAVGGDDLFGRAWRAAAAFTAPATGVLDLSVAAPDDGDWSDPSDDAPIAAMRFVEPDVTPELFVPPSAPWRVTVQVEVGTSRAAGRRTPRSGARSSGSGVRPTRSGCRSPSVLRASRACWCCRPGPRPTAAGPPSRASAARRAGSRRRSVWPRRWRRGGSPRSPPAGSARRTRPRRSRRCRSSASRTRSACSPTTRRSTAVGSWRWRSRAARRACSPRRPPTGRCLPGPGAGQPEQRVLAGDRGRRGDPRHPVLDARGQAVPWRPVRSGELMGQLVRNAWRVGRDRGPHRPTLLRLRAAYSAGLAHGTGGELAAERFGGPLLLLSGSEDAVWPSGRPMAEAIVAAARERGRPARPVRGRRAPRPARRPAHRRAVDRRHRPRRRPRGPGGRPTRRHHRGHRVPERGDRGRPEGESPIP